MIIASTVKMSEKHKENLVKKFPTYIFTYFENMDELMEHGDHETQVLITYGRDITTAVLDHLPHLKWIQVLSAGVDQLPFQTLQEKGIMVTNVRGIHGIPMAEYTMGIMLHHVRNLSSFYMNQQQKLWSRNIQIDELTDKTIGIIGAGAIGSEIAKRAKVFDMRVIGLNQDGRECNFFDQMYSTSDKGKLLSESDFIVLLLPLTPATYRFIGEEDFKQMKSSSVFINISRGQTVDEKGLIKALQEKWIEAAYLDVFEEEPLPEDHPLWSMENCWITPHVAALSPNYMRRAVDILVHNLGLFQQGKPMKMLNFINMEKGY